MIDKPLELAPSCTGSISTLKILLVSDIHNHFSNLQKLKDIYQAKPEKFDYVFALGDFDVIKPVPGEEINDQNNNYTDLKRILTDLEYFSVPVIYIPGNHDPIGLFLKDPQLTTNSVYLQNQSYLIGDGLQVIGLGGSLPGYYETDGLLTINLDSYPYSNEQDLGKDLESVTSKFCNESVQTLLLTHVGPYYSSTSHIYIEKKGCNLLLGSKELDKTLKNTKLNILADLHGHVHPSIGRTNINKVQVINPGSLFEGNYGVLVLEKGGKDTKWMISKSEFINLNAYSNSIFNKKENE